MVQQFTHQINRWVVSEITSTETTSDQGRVLQRGVNLSRIM